MEYGESMLVLGVHCYNCNTFVYSRARHDMIACKCWNENKQSAIAIDGGQEDYFKITSGSKCKYKLCKMNIPDANIETLFKDWNERKNKLGTVNNPDENDITYIMKNEKE